METNAEYESKERARVENKGKKERKKNTEDKETTRGLRENVIKKETESLKEILFAGKEHSDPQLSAR